MLAAVCIPTFPEPAHRWLQKLRAAHDPEYSSLIAPHLTLVFPNSVLTEADFISHVASYAREARATEVEFFSAQEYHDAGTGLDFVYLIPSVGYAWFVQLHEKLHSGPLASQRRRDVAFIPHITVGRFTGGGSALALAATLKSERNAIAGRVEAIDVVEVGDDLVRHVHREPLGAG